METNSKLGSCFADMHIHIGASHTGRPIKITGSRSLTLSNILYEAKYKKGMDLIGVIDCHSPEVLKEMNEMILDETLVQLKGGGLSYNGLTIIPGSEIEIYDDNCHGPIHVLVFMPDLKGMEKLSSWLADGRMKNVHLSSQRMYGSGLELQKYVKNMGGLFIPAHIFTPFKSLYGKGVKASLTEVFDPELIDGVELGLSSNTEMAACISEISAYAFLTNSDAHSLEKIGREYQMLALEKPTFEEFELALKGRKGRTIIANYGLNPYLGKYYNTACAKCLHPNANFEEKVCTQCSSTKFIKGVYDRIQELKTSDAKPENRPPYINQVPLEFIPGLGPKSISKLREAFGTDMDIIHSVPIGKLNEIVKPSIAAMIGTARTGNLSVKIGGGGKYGKIVKNKTSKK
jgi:uncharacterized protein (TIGR00375 family)